MNPPSTLRWVTLCMGTVWILLVASLGFWALRNEQHQTFELARHQARAFFQEIVTTRAWNAAHGGVYVPITENTQPNPYLDDPQRDVITTGGLRLTKINPAFMTRQIGEIAEQRGHTWFHITSLNPIRPANRPDAWEIQGLAAFSKGVEDRAEFLEDRDGHTVFRYMAPIWVEKSCLPCHAVQGYREGQLRGGISVTLPADSFMAVENRAILQTISAFFTITCIGLLALILGFRRLTREERLRQQAFTELQNSLAKVKTLGGLLPICSVCKKIRDDQGYWKQIERYVEENSEAEFSHSICQECARIHYPDIPIYPENVQNTPPHPFPAEHEKRGE